MTELAQAMKATATLADDLLRGADEIAVFIYGDGKHRTKVYHAADKHGLPVFRIGGVLHARKSTIMDWIEHQEKGGCDPAAGARAPE